MWPSARCGPLGRLLRVFGVGFRVLGLGFGVREGCERRFFFFFSRRG